MSTPQIITASVAAWAIVSVAILRAWVRAFNPDRARVRQAARRENLMIERAHQILEKADR